MTDDKAKLPLPPSTPPDDKKYAQIWRDFVRHCGDAVGFDDISTDIAALLAEDSNYRLREAVNNAGQFMRHAKRKKLSSVDFNNALRWSDVEPVYGYSSSDPLPFINIKEADIFCTEDHEINLVLMATRKHAYENPGIPSVKAQWMAVEGIPKNDSLSITGAGKKNGVATALSTISDNLMTYYNQVTKAILGTNEEVALEDLKRNSRIAPLLPFFINFVCVGVKKVSHDLNQLNKLMRTVRSLTDNHYMYLGPRPLLKMLVQGVLYCIVEPLAASLNPINDHWALRDYAARLLANIVRLWDTPVNQLYKNTLNALKDIFRDLTKPFCSHYGAVIAIMALGIEPVRSCIYPNMAKYWSHLTSALDDSSLANVPFKSDANKVYGALLMASEFLIIHEQRQMVTRTDTDIEVHSPAPVIKSEFPSTSSKTNVTTFSTSIAYNELYGYFGDALAMRLPYLRLQDFYAPRSSPLVKLFTSPELMQTGDELLEAFNVKDEETQSNSADDDRYSYDDNSPMSDEPEPSVDVDLRIKSTVSDPTLGIKLTIAKLPRSIPPVAPSAPVTSSEPTDKLVKKLSIKISKDQLTEPSVVMEPDVPFEVTIIKRSRMFIEFNFDGSMPVPRNALKRKRIEEHPFNQTSCAENSYKTSLKMKTINKIKHKRSRFHDANYERAIRIFRSVDILTVM